MELLELDAQIRDKSANVKSLRQQRVIPAVCYGKGYENRSIGVDYQSFRKLFNKIGSSQVFNLNVDGQKLPVLVHEVSYNPMTDEFNHIDFLQINMKEEVTASVPVELVGESPAIKMYNAVVTLIKDEIEVRCMPMDLPPKIELDVTKLENIGDAIRISDLQLGNKVEILDDLEETLVSVSAVEEYKEEEVEVPDDIKAEPVVASADKVSEEKEEKAD